MKQQCPWHKHAAVHSMNMWQYTAYNTYVYKQHSALGTNMRATALHMLHAEICSIQTRQCGTLVNDVQLVYGFQGDCFDVLVLASSDGTVQLISKLTLTCVEHACVLQFLLCHMRLKCV